MKKTAHAGLLGMLAAGSSLVASPAFANNPFRGGNPVVVREPDATGCGTAMIGDPDQELWNDLVTRGDLDATIADAIRAYRLNEHDSWGAGNGISTPGDNRRPVGKMVIVRHLLLSGFLDLWTDGQGRSAPLRSGITPYANPGLQWHGGSDYRGLSNAASSSYHDCFVYRLGGTEGNTAAFVDALFGTCGSMRLGCQLFTSERYGNPAYRAASIVHEAQHAFWHDHGFDYTDDLDGNNDGHIDAERCPNYDGADTLCDRYHFHRVRQFEYPISGSTPEYVNQGLDIPDDSFVCDWLPQLCDHVGPIHSPFQTSWEMACDLVTHPGPFVPASVVEEAESYVDDVWTYFFQNRPPIVCSTPAMVRNRLPAPDPTCDQVLDCSFDPETRRVNVLGSAVVAQDGDPPGIEVAVLWEGCSNFEQAATPEGDPNLFSFTTMQLDSSNAISTDTLSFLPASPRDCRVAFQTGEQVPEVKISATIDGLPNHCGCSARFTATGDLVSEASHQPVPPPPPPPPPPLG